MHKRIILIVAAFLMASSGPVLAKKPSSGPPTLDCTVFVSSYDGGQIQCVKVNGNQVTVKTIFEELDGSFYPEDMTMGPDKHLYVTDPTHHQILRINGDASSGNFLTAEPIYNLSAPSTPFAEPQGPSFHGNDLYVNSENGVFRFSNIAGKSFGTCVPLSECSSTVKVVNDFGDGEGTDFRLNGQLLMVDRTGHRVMSAGPPFTGAINSTKVFNSLTTPIGIAVSPADAVYVADFGARKILLCTAGCSTVKTFSGTDAPYFIEHDLNGNLWVATEDVDGNGKLWRFQNGVAPSNPLVKFADFATKGNKPGAIKTPRAQGLAIPPTGRTCGTFNFSAGGTHDFNCASYTVRVKSDVACNMTLKVQQTFPSDLNESLDDDFPMSSPSCVSDDYGNGLCAILSDGQTCVGDKTVTVFYSRFEENGLTDFPALVRRDDAQSSWEEETLAYLAKGIFPGDPGRTGGTKRSDITLADMEVDGDFSEFFPPFSNCGNNCVYQMGSSTPVKFQIFENGQEVTNAEPRLSVQDVDNNDILLPSSVGSAVDNIASYSGGQYHYNLKLVQGFIKGHKYRLVVIAANYLGPRSITFTVK